MALSSERHEGRTYEPLKCWLCKAPPSWHVTDDRGDELLACEAHKWSAFS